MKKKTKIFNAKILLFGEYTVLLNSKALTIPYTFFSGHLSFIGEDKYTKYDQAQKSNKDMLAFLDYLKTGKKDLIEQTAFDLDEMEKDLKNGLFFESNIPQGYGVGSSGALVAAVYNKYSGNRIKETNSHSIVELKKIFSVMESYFHMTSSGMDPLNCYIGKPLLISTRKEINIVNVPHQNNNADGAIFLIDSGYPGETEPMMTLFINKIKNISYRNDLLSHFIPLNNRCIDEVTNGDIIGFFKSLNILSDMQLRLFPEMIPEKFLDIWKQGLESGKFTLKLCGSGGGGFLLGFTMDYTEAELLMKKNNIEMIPVFKNSIFRRT